MTIVRCGGIILAGLVCPSNSWGSAGHREIAEIAGSVLFPNTDIFVRRVLGVEDARLGLIDASTWADMIEDPDTDEYHYVHSTYRTCDPFIEARDCGANGKCIVTGIAKYVQELHDGVDADVALKMLIHLMGDLHQPMHAGFEQDMGGVKIKLEFPEMSLHELWDSHLVDSTPKWSIYQERAELVTREKERLTNYESTENWVGDIVSEISSTFTCPWAYQDGGWIDSGAVLSEEYLATRSESVRDLLVIAGVRLGVLLNGIAGILESKRPVKIEEPLTVSDKESTNMYSSLTIEEFDFDPFQIQKEQEGMSSAISQVRTPPMTPSGEPLPELGLKRMDNRSWSVTSLDKIRAGISVDFCSCFEVYFPKNPKRVGKKVVLCFDVNVFRPTSMLQDVNFFMQVIAWLRRLPPPLRSSEIRIKDPLEDMNLRGILVGYPEGIEGFIESPRGDTKIFANGIIFDGRPEIEREREMMVVERVAASRFPDEPNKIERIRKHYQRELLRKCDDIIGIVSTKNYNLFMTTTSSINAVISGNKKAFKASWFMVSHPAKKGAITFRFVDTQLSPYPLTDEFLEMAQACMVRKSNVAKAHAINKNQYWSKLLMDLALTLTAARDHHDQLPERKLINKVMGYAEKSPAEGFTLFMLEWDLNPLNLPNP